MKRIFGTQPCRDLNPDEVVAIGAAIQTSILQGEITDLVLLDVTPHALGIESPNGSFLTIIERGTNIPTISARPFHLDDVDATYRLSRGVESVAITCYTDTV